MLDYTYPVSRLLAACSGQHEASQALALAGSPLTLMHLSNRIAGVGQPEIKGTIALNYNPKLKPTVPSPASGTVQLDGIKVRVSV